MIRLDTPPDAIDRAYAKGLYELAQEKGGRALLEELAGEFDELVDMFRGNPQLEEFVASLIVPSPVKETSLRTIFEGRIHQYILNLMLLLNIKERDGRFVRVAAAFDEMVQQAFGKVEVDVYTRLPIPEDQLALLKERLQQTLGREPVVYAYTDESMLGGIRIRVGDKLVDASYRTRLRMMQERLTEQGVARMRERASDAIED
ncbi:MAG: hypothetical protein Tsb0013_24620 [Phycisphaerales bacterium]